MSSLVLKRASASRSSGEWNDDDFDVLARRRRRPHHEGRRCADRHVMDVDARVRIPRGPHTDARLRADARGRDGGVRQELAAAVSAVEAKTEVETTSILPSKVKTARSWRGILASTHLAREGRMTVTIGRRELLAALGGAAATWPLAARAQQPAMPLIGLLDIRSPETMTDRLRAFRQGLKDAGLAIEYRWAEGQYDRLPALAAELDRRKVAVIVASGGPAPALAAAKAATTTPIVFVTAEDPVKLGLVANLARPGGNLTGVSMLTGELAAKRLEFLRELVPGAVRVAAFINPNNPGADNTLKELDAAARAMGLQVQIFTTSTSRETDAAFATFVRERPDALFVAGDAFFNSRRLQLALLAARHGLPATYPSRDYPVSGGLMSYGTNIGDAFRQLGAYAGRILKGTNPADLPVVQSSKFELVINHQTARMLGLTVPDKLLATADEVIE